ncbi:MAG: Nramp family divalent metal transporter, partial [Vicinamibacteraceae bacterium]
MAEPDLYTITSDSVETPPRALGAALKRIGPGMVLAASIVGSGELIATTTLGAEVGYLALWIIVASCVIKPVVQGELGRYTIATGETALEAFATVPGPRVPGTGGRVNWLVGCWLLTVLLSLLQVGGMFGGVAQVLNLLMPGISVNVWVGICLALTLALLLGGGYSRIEKLAVIKVSFFTVLTVCAAAVLLWTPGAVSSRDLADGFALQLPKAGLSTAIAVFGITGV